MPQTKKASYKRQIFLMSSKETETFVVNRELWLCKGAVVRDNYRILLWWLFSTLLLQCYGH